MLNKAIEEALKSTDFKHKVGCVIIDRYGKVIAKACNIRKTHPLQNKYSIRVLEFNKDYLHAEVAALIKCRKDPYAIYVARTNKNGVVGLAKPCPICMLAIQESGIKQIVYTTKNSFETLVL